MMTVEEFLAARGVTKCAPGHAAGNEMKGAARRHVAKKRAEWVKETGVALKVGMVEGVEG